MPAKSITDDPDALADYLAAALLPDSIDRFTTEATLLLLFFAATTDPDDELPFETIADLSPTAIDIARRAISR
jgi:hypothetical protein